MANIDDTVKKLQGAQAEKVRDLMFRCHSEEQVKAVIAAATIYKCSSSYMEDPEPGPAGTTVWGVFVVGTITQMQGVLDALQRWEKWNAAR